MGQSHANNVASSSFAPDSPLSEERIDQLAVQLANLQSEMEKVKTDNAKLRIALLADEDDATLKSALFEEEDEAQKQKELVVPESHFLTPVKPTLEASWAENWWTDWSQWTEWSQKNVPTVQLPGFDKTQEASAPLGASWVDWKPSSQCIPGH